MADIPVAPASDRNKLPIAAVLGELIPKHAKVLEIGSGWGQHAVYFCQQFPHLSWQPTEMVSEMEYLRARLDREGSANIRPAVELDVVRDAFPDDAWDVIYTANTAHIMPWSAVETMVAKASEGLLDGGLMIFYGPFKLNGDFTSDGNRSFDRDLRSRAPHMGLREFEALETLAQRHQLSLCKRIDMPANNMLLCFNKETFETGDQG